MTENERIILIETEQRSKSNTHRLDEMETSIREIQKENKAIYKIASSVEVMAEKLGNIEDKIDETKRKVDETARAQAASEKKFLERISEVENAPAIQTAKNVNDIKLKIAMTVAGFLITGMLGALIYFVK